MAESNCDVYFTLRTGQCPKTVGRTPVRVVGLPTCVAQLLPLWARVFSLNTDLKAVDVTDLGSRGTYGIKGLS